VTSLLEAKAEVNTVTDVRTPTTRTWEYQYWYWGVRRRDLRKVFSNCFSYQIDCNTCLVTDNFDFSRNQAGQTPLMMAADAGQTSVVTLLLAAKAQVNLANSVSYRHIYIYTNVPAISISNISDRLCMTLLMTCSDTMTWHSIIWPSCLYPTLRIPFHSTSERQNCSIPSIFLRPSVGSVAAFIRRRRNRRCRSSKILRGHIMSSALQM
jgi:hypothetical protein